MAGSYRCLYYAVYARWSERSEPLQLQVTEEDSTPPSGFLWSEPSDLLQLQVTEEVYSTAPSGPASRDYTVENSIRLGLAGAVLLILVAILVEAGLSQRRTPQGPQE
ncbi:T-cell-interacting, activating receptor on myeloid cells protein 1 [Myotis davidii]|nr:T-cell-interacting, activating receptor on myeloid cells protein 1 [Myotis davidii]